VGNRVKSRIDFFMQSQPMWLLISLGFIIKQFKIMEHSYKVERENLMKGSVVMIVEEIRDALIGSI